MGVKMTGCSGGKAMERAIGNFLRAGVIIAASAVFLGGVIYLFRHGHAVAEYAVFQRVPAGLCSVRGILSSAFSFHGRGFIQLGLLLLIATPVSRVVYAVLAFARRKDFLYSAVALAVFCILAYSLSGR